MYEKITPVLVTSFWDKLLVLWWNLCQIIKDKDEKVRRFYRSQEYWDLASQTRRREILEQVGKIFHETEIMRDFYQYPVQDWDFLNYAVCKYERNFYKEQEMILRD